MRRIERLNCVQFLKSLFKGDFEMTKKLVAIILALTLSISVFMVPASAASVVAPQTLEINIENVFNRVLNDLIHYVLTYLNRFWPGFEEEFDSSETYDFNTENIDSPSTFGLFFRMIVVLIIVVAFIYLLFFFISAYTIPIISFSSPF